MDYEQSYYDLKHQIKELNKKVDILEQELQIYKSLQKNKSTKNIIIEDLLKYLIKKSELERVRVDEKGRF